MKKTESSSEHIADMIEKILGEACPEEKRYEDPEERDGDQAPNTEREYGDENIPYMVEEDIIDLNEPDEEDPGKTDEHSADISQSGSYELYGKEDEAGESDEQNDEDESEEQYEEDESDEYDGEIVRKPKKKRKRKRRVALWKKLLLTLEFLILAAIILAAVYLVRSGVFEESDVVFGELAVEEIYYVAGQSETAKFTVQAANSEKEMQLCDTEGNVVGTLSDDGQNGDETADDGIYTCTLTFSDADTGAQTYYVREAKTTSSEVTVYLFPVLDGDAFESACAVCGDVRSALREIEAGYTGTSGYVSEEHYPELFAEVEAYLKTLAADGTIIRYVVEDESAYIKFASGLSLCYEPILEDTFSGESDVQLTVTYIQTSGESYAADCEEVLANTVAQIENLESGATYEGSAVTLSLVKSLSSDQVIVWYGHGAYSSVTGSGLILDITMETFSESLSTEDQADLFRDNLTTVWLEDGEQYLAVTPAYITKYCGDLSNDLIFLSACNGGKDARLAEAFLGCGAAAVLCFSDSVLCGYASGVIDGVLQYMLCAWPESEWYYTLEQALERAENVLGENDAVWLEKYADTQEFSESIVACGAEPLLLTRQLPDEDNAENDSEDVSEIRLSTEQGSLYGTAYYYADSPEPAAGATVTVRQGDDLYMELATDENGEYSIEALPVGTYDITFSLSGYSDYYQEDIVIYRDGQVNADGYFFANDKITGTVIDSLTGKPLAEVETELLIWDDETIYKQTVLTDENGTYTFDLTEESKSAALSELVKYFEGSDYSELLQGSSLMTEKRLSPEGVSGYTMGISGSGVILFEKDGYVSGTVEVTVTGFDSPDMGTEELTPQVEITGYVYDANGNALGGVAVSAVVTDDGSSVGQDEQSEEDDTDNSDSEEETETADAEATETVQNGSSSEVEQETSSTAATGDTIETETDIDGSYSLGFDLGSKITIRVTYSLSGYDTKTVEYEIDSSMIVDGKVQLAGVSLARTKQVVTGTSYASSVVSFESGDPWTSMANAMNPADALGEPDYSNNKNAVTLGAGGVLILGFDVDFCNGDGIDIYIYEAGDDVETTLVEVSRDGETWVNVGTVSGSTSGIDIEGKVSASSTFRYIRLTDLGSHTSGWWPGADIDAVAVTHYMQ